MVKTSIRRTNVHRNRYKNAVDFLFFPLRALILIENDKLGLSSLASERFSYVSKEVQGFCLDVGCGKHNRFITEFLRDNGKGIDCYRYEGLTEKHIVANMEHFPFDDSTFDSVTFIANINHIPSKKKDIELSEAYRCLKKGGNIIITMGNPLAELLVHKLVSFYDRFLGTNLDLDNIRGMDEEESYYLLDKEIKARLNRAGFININKKYFPTQWYLNHMFIAWKR